MERFVVIDGYGMMQHLPLRAEATDPLGRLAELRAAVEGDLEPVKFGPVAGTAVRAFVNENGCALGLRSNPVARLLIHYFGLPLPRPTIAGPLVLCGTSATTDITGLTEAQMAMISEEWAVAWG